MGVAAGLPGSDGSVADGAQSRAKPKQSILYWRKSIFDPDRFFTWLEPKIRFFWTRAFLVVSGGCILAAALVLWTNGQQAATSFNHASAGKRSFSPG